jgi:ATP-dependent Clp protease ATP-binding subunit ClpA
MLSITLEQTLQRALSLASDRRHNYATLEHLLLGLADDTDAAPVLRACGVDLDKLRSDLSEFLDKDLAGLATDGAGDPKPTAGFQRVMQRAVIHVQSSRRDEVTGANVLVSLFSEQESHAVYFLLLQNMTRLDAVNFISFGIAKSRTHGPPNFPERRRTTGENQRVTVEQLAKIRALEDFDLIRLISEIHDHGWDVASHTLSMMPPRQSDRSTS